MTDTNRVMPRRSYEANAVPTATDEDILQHELVINWSDGIVYTRSAANQIISWNLSGGGSDPRWDYLLPGAPTSLAATGASGQATLSWTAPSSVVAISDYTVQYSANNGTSWTTFSDGTSASNAATVNNLTNGTAYSFRVAAVSGIGQGGWSNTATATPGGDEYASSVVLFLNFDGATIEDVSATPKSLTNVNDVTIDGGAGRFTRTNAYTNPRRLLTASSSAFAAGTQDLTVEFWHKAETSHPGVLFHLANNDGYSGVYIRVTGSAYVAGASDGYWQGGYYSISGGSYATGEWNHVALTRWYDATASAYRYRLWVNGTQVAAKDEAGGFTVGGTQLAIGGYPDTADVLCGWLDNVKYTVGVARYKAAFTPPTSTHT